ncbi:uridine kinase family protein [Cerasicoccus frondis]|uniref:uridine kinase family protein n=1 Tax=Cerasicoccus frondis TaxID=490090 RepID=UPI002852B558|nr:uridine-cytidine kinase [Cerasicoccus frondis]
MTARIIGICGGTASGKSTLTRRLVEALPDVKVAELGIDRFYRGPPVKSWDAPEALEAELLLPVVEALASGRDVEVPVYDYHTHSRAGYETFSADFELLIIEGLFPLHWPAIRQRLDFSVYVDCPDDIRLARRLVRDIKERGRDVDNVVEQYLTSVRPMHEQYVAPQKALADLVVDGQDLAGALAQVVARVKALLAR